MNEEIVAEIFNKKMLNESFRELTTAILCGKKCGGLKPAQMRKTTDELMNEMFIYYGQNINAETTAMMKDIFPIELNKFHPGFTLEEIAVGVRMSMREMFGEIEYKKVSIKLLNELINKYSISQMRQKVISAYNTCMETMQVETKFMTPEQKEQYVIDSICNKHERFVKQGKEFVILSFMDYESLARHAAVPDFKEFVELAATRFKDNRPKGNATTIEMELNRQMALSIASEAKKMAIESLFQKLKESGTTLKQHITICSTK